ncbi:MAG: hypothetical protein DWQ47_05460 [Acidobacteria bacterium]|nr:MAG: hypothetical protein DWQ32_09010 [Acidobacteriota bacterium]REK01829.1 MAG: hypothetical protein DWQ38_05445 [Acidobacteriota bacterium]REK14785.1 MAG: hypothetical protein DWQ43_14700 [Acidobacteriota bacterium]REK45500.1 MAG: hypothetical protein DWQ47_05460 [Acidobacteriota bacterium]
MRAADSAEGADGAKKSGYLIDVTSLAESSALANANGLDKEVADVASVLSRSVSGNAVLVGEYYLSHSAIVDNLAYRISSERVPSKLKKKRLYRLDIPALVKDSDGDPAVFDALVKQAVESITSGREKGILDVFELDAFARVNPSMGAAAAKSLREAVESGSLIVITSGTNADFERIVATDPILRKRFTKVDVEADRETLEDPFVGSKISPDLSEAIAKRSPNEIVSVILQADDVRSGSLRDLLGRHGIEIRSEAANMGVLELNLPLSLAQTIAADRSARHLSLDHEMVSFGHIEDTTGYSA